MSPLLYRLLIAIFKDRCMCSCVRSALIVHEKTNLPVDLSTTNTYSIYCVMSRYVHHSELCERGEKQTITDARKKTNNFCRVQTTNFNAIQYSRKENESLHPDLADDA